MKKDLVIVESPAKAKTIASYLGGKMKVLASYGHIRDLPSKEGVVEPNKDFAMHWSYNERGAKRLAEISASAKDSECLYLATDPDREGEAIAWHVLEALKQKKTLPPKIKRVVFHEITPQAVADSFADAADEINQALVEAYLARRALDYLFGFTLSPILWRRLPGSRSAGRVQSAAVRLIAEREAERLVFKAVPYWLAKAAINHHGKEFSASLATVGGDKVDKFYFKSHDAAEQLLRNLKTLAVGEITEKEQRAHPPPPFTTSSLQQAASTRLGFSAAGTMRTAQNLYESGLITYMRTDSVVMAKTAIANCRKLIAEDGGKQFVPPQPNFYKGKVKNAQEAHEAIRPTNFFRRPSAVQLDGDGRKLYQLIWQRAVASQTASALINKTSVELLGEGGLVFRASGSVIAFEGFLRFYPRRKLEGEKDDQLLPPLKKGELLSDCRFSVSDHETKPPPRYNEASLVQTLEEKGIGRPSTYATIISTVQERGYARLEKRQFIPTGVGMMAAAFFRRFFKDYVAYDFTAQMEEKLDNISNGKKNRLELLGDFWGGLQEIVKHTEGISVRQVITDLETECADIIFLPQEGQSKEQARTCPKCGKPLGLKLGRGGPFIGCSAYPDCKYISNLFESPLARPSSLGKGEDGSEITLKDGPYGPYLQLDDPTKPKPKRVSLPKGVDPASLTKDLALAYISLPRPVGDHPEGGEVSAGVGMYGPYVRHGKIYASLRVGDDVLTVGINRAVTLLAEKQKGGGSRFAAPKAIKVLEGNGEKLEVFEGKYGPYVKKAAKPKPINASLPKGMAIADLNYEQAAELIAKRLDYMAKKGGKR